MNPQDVITEGNKRIKEILAQHKEFEKIEECIQMTEDVTIPDVETISACTSRMTAYLSNLAGVVPKYTSMANSQYIYRKFSLMWEFKKVVANTVKEKEQEALSRTESEHFEELVLRYVADYLKSKYDAYEKHTSVLQSRLGILRNELFRANT